PLKEAMLPGLPALDLDTCGTWMTTAAELCGDRRDINIHRNATHADAPTVLVAIQDRGCTRPFGTSKEIDHAFRLARLSTAFGKRGLAHLGPDQLSGPLNLLQRALPQADRGFGLEPEESVH